jgi:type II secretory pathway predicted ATPase ExeA
MPTPTTDLKVRQLAQREKRVFASYPQVERYFPAAAIEDARQRLCRTIERGDGPALVIGAPGTGKSQLLQVLAAQYHERFDVVLPACARLCTRRAMLQSILFELDLPYKMRDEGELRLSLLDHLLSKNCPAGLLLLVDEAQSLPVALLDELRVLTNLVRGGVPRVRLVLAGSSALEELFANPELESFSQRLSARCYLAPLSREETTEYIRAQIAAHGFQPEDIFAPDAWEAVFEATDGVPRLVNQLSDRALLLCVTKSCPRIDRHVIHEAWSDIQQLPTPWDTDPIPATAATTSQVVEFGRLSDDVPEEYKLVEDAVYDLEPTDLDQEDEAAHISESIINRSASSPVTASAADPFGEDFDEEEIVLDNFAAWDDLFRRDVQRVENRRDPGFSTLVQAAIEASPISASRFAASQTSRSLGDLELSPLITTVEDCSFTRRLSDEESPAESPTSWPRLRLAEVGDVAPREQLPPFAASANRTSGAADISPQIASQSYSHVPPVVEDPILIIDEENAVDPSRPPVRREEYRNLFSRLRSG